MEYRVEENPHYGEVVSTFATDELPSAEVKFEEPITINGQFGFEFKLPMKTLTNVGYPPNAGYSQ